MLKNITISEDFYRYNAIKNIDDFKNVKVNLSDINNKMTSMVDGIILDGLSQVLYHNIPKVLGMYAAVLGYSKSNEMNIQPDVIKNVMKAITVRHDIVHRDGKNKKGEIILLDETIVNRHIMSIRVFMLRLWEVVETVHFKRNGNKNVLDR